MKELSKYLVERKDWVDDVKVRWHPIEGLFTWDDPKKIADYLMKHSKDRKQAMSRLVFYMNRAGDDMKNRDVLNTVKELLSDSVDESHSFLVKSSPKKSTVLKPTTVNELRRIISTRVGIYGPDCDLNDIDVSGITDMSYLFSWSVVDEFNGDISGWDVSNVKIMTRMFDGSKFNGDISNWDVSNVEDMSYMFRDSSFNGDIGMWDVSNVINMRNMFTESEFNKDINEWDVSNVKNFLGMFSDSKFNKPLNRWNIKSAEVMQAMFMDSCFNQDISSWDISGVTNMRYMFDGSKFDKDLSSWKPSPSANISGMFSNCPLYKNKPEWYKY